MKVDKVFSASFNTLREINKGKEFSRKEIYNLFLENIPKFPKQQFIVSIFERNGILLKRRSGKNVNYMFTVEPVHIAKLAQCVNILNKYNCERMKKHREKEIEMEVVTATSVTEEYCIAFLKERGYKIMKQIINFEEV